SIYLKYAGKDREKLASDVSSIEYVSKDITTVYYIKEDSLYKQVEGEDKEKIASDVYNVIKIYESGEIYYLTKEETTASLMDYVDDDMKEADASIVEPEYPDYPTSPSSPSWWDYDTDEEYNAAYEAYEKAYEEWEAEYDRMQEEYYAAREAYYDKQSRDELREDLEDETINQTTYSLYFYDGTKDTMITDSFAYGYDYYSEYYSDYSYASDAPVITYETCKTSDIEKTKLSEIEGFYSFENTIDEALSSASRERYIAAKSNAVIVEQEKNATNFKLNSAGTVVYYIDDIPDEENYGELYCISINDGKIGKAELYDSDVRTSYSYFANENDFVYFKDVKDGKGELYINKNRIDYDVECYSVSYDSESGKTVYLTDYNSEKDYGTLKIHDGKKATKIADDVHTFYTTPEGRVLYLYDYSLNYYKGELCEWYNGETRHIDEDVNGILITNDGAYMDY
ncbi:MAG: hypothetical protein IJB24_07180, partial [Clostridia bacterium]|nr:hypothetical protein [Clostridia bacterium]